MKPLTLMLVAGEASGDKLAAELVLALRPALLRQLSRTTHDLQPCHTGIAPCFFGAGGPLMAAAGVELVEETTTHAVFGLSEVLRHLNSFRRLLRRLAQLAWERQPEVIVLVDSSGFNRRLAAAIRRRVWAGRGSFNNWNPRIVCYVSPQVWASRPGRAYQLARDVDLLLSIFPFEPEWYAQRTPDLRVEFIGHPLVDRYPPPSLPASPEPAATSPPLVLLLPGSREQELRRHLPPMLEALRIIRTKANVRAHMVLPNEALQALAQQMATAVPDLQTRVGCLADSLAQARLAIASSGTVTLESAYFRVPTVVVYRVSWPTYWVARQIVQVPYIAMPNLLADAPVFPEFVQGDVTAENIAREALDLLLNPARRDRIRQELHHAIASLGPPGASERAAQAILRLLPLSQPRP
jgi:lipid-A-disaccharide synthase